MPSPALRACELLVRRGLRGVWVRGEPPAGPFVWAANHHSWWDPFVAATVISRLGRGPSLLVAQENIERFGVARLLGGFGTGQLRRGVRDLRRGRVLIVFPEGELRPPAALGRLAGGAAWYARQAAVPLTAVACRVVLRGHQSAEAYVWLSTVDASLSAELPPASTADTRVPVDAAVDRPPVSTGDTSESVEAVTGRLRERMAGQLRALDELVGQSTGGAAREPLPGFRPCLRGRRSWDERIGGTAGARPERRPQWSRR